MIVASVLVTLSLLAAACTQPQLIENAELNQNRIYEIIKRTSDASGLKVTQPLSAKLLKRHEFDAVVNEGSNKKKSGDAVVLSSTQYAMGLLADGPSLNGDYASVIARTAAGLYVSRTRTLYLIDEPARTARGGLYLNTLGTLGNEVTLAHEVVHALQHLHYPSLFEPEQAAWPHQKDASLALLAAKEGDASLWAAQSLGFMGRAQAPDKVLSLARDMFSPLGDTQPLMREYVAFPYTYGYRYAYLEGRDGLASPPASTEQVIHATEDERQSFLAMDLSGVILSLEQDGCRVIDHDTMGELLLSLWLRGFDPAVIEAVWEGWDGDRWLVADCGSRGEIAWFTSWDTEADAREFEQAFAGIASTVQARAHVAAPVTVERQGREVVVTSGGLRSKMADLHQLVHRARVTTRAELAAHFSNIK